MKIKLKENRKNIITDTTTPVSMYLKIRDKYINSILLESSDYSSKDNNYAYICFNPIAEFKIKNFDLKISLPNKKTINNIAAVEKSAGKINPQIITIGHKIGVTPNLKSLILSFLCTSILAT